MNVSRENIEVLKHLSVPEKIFVIGEIWDSIARGNEYPELTVCQAEELNKRIDSYYANPEQGRTWDEIRNNFLQSVRINAS